MIDLISIVVLTFALASIILGAITIWLENRRRRLLGIALTVIGLLTGIAYTFLGSRFSLVVFGHLLVRVDLPALMATAFTYTAGVLMGIVLATGLFLWATGRFHKEIGRPVVVVIVAGLLFAALATAIAALLGAR
ncbi:MAG: hypothetical protein MUQ10_00540 [Anaerolineae bacterium]|nr:hypothetical protein [Anaerolineae bacterium]